MDVGRHRHARQRWNSVPRPRDLALHEPEAAERPAPRIESRREAVGQHRPLRGQRAVRAGRDDASAGSIGFMGPLYRRTPLISSARRGRAVQSTRAGLAAAVAAKGPDERRTEAGDVHGLREHRPRREGSAVQAVRAQAGPGATRSRRARSSSAGRTPTGTASPSTSALPRMGHRADRRPPVALQRQELGGHPDGRRRPRPRLRQDAHRHASRWSPGDSDFSPLVSKLRENDRYVIGLGVKSSSSRSARGQLRRVHLLRGPDPRHEEDDACCAACRRRRPRPWPSSSTPSRRSSARTRRRSGARWSSRR